METIFLDSASTTRTDDKVTEAMIDALKVNYGNPSSTHYFGRQAEKLVSDARKIIADSIGAKPAELFFTSSGTEANNMALFGLARANKHKGKHIISSYIEHQSIIDSVKKLQSEGFEVSYVKVDADGQVDIEHLR